jgi:hypothetical protein
MKYFCEICDFALFPAQGLAKNPKTLKNFARNSSR